MYVEGKFRIVSASVNILLSDVVSSPSAPVRVSQSRHVRYRYVVYFPRRSKRRRCVALAVRQRCRRAGDSSRAR